MKQNFTHLFFLAFFVALLMPSSVRAEDIPVAILTTNADGKTKTLTFTYADQSALNQPGNGQDGTYELPTGEAIPGWLKGEDKEDYSIKTVVFDSLFSKARPTTTYKWFNNLRALTMINGLEYLCTEDVTNMSYMFRNCRSLTSLDLRSFNTQKVKDMRKMFYYCEELASVNLTSFNTSNVTSMWCMFTHCFKLQSIDLSSFTLAKDVDVSDMFWDCRRLKSIDISNFNISNARFAYAMFGWCSSLRSINVGNNDFSSIADKRNVFEEVGTEWPCYLIIGDSFKMTELGEKTEFGLYNWLAGTFTLTTNATIPVGQILTNDDGQTKTLQFTYKDVDVTKHDEYWADGIYPLTKPSDSPGWARNDAVSVVFDQSFSKARPRSTFAWFNGMENLTSISGMEYLNTSETTDMAYMFSNCKSIRELDISSLNTKNVTLMYDMFSGCTSLTKLDISGFDMSKVTDVSNMFVNCSNLTNLNLGGCDFKNLGTSNCFSKVGTEAVPCNIIINENFDKSVLGDKITDGSYSYYNWRGGYFAEPTVVPTAIESISMDKGFNQNAPAYNLSGQRVGKGYKGIVIQKGRKYVRK